MARPLNGNQNRALNLSEKASRFPIRRPSQEDVRASLNHSTVAASLGLETEDNARSTRYEETVKTASSPGPASSIYEAEKNREHKRTEDESGIKDTFYQHRSGEGQKRHQTSNSPTGDKEESGYFVKVSTAAIDDATGPDFQDQASAGTEKTEAIDKNAFQKMIPDRSASDPTNQALQEDVLTVQGNTRREMEENLAAAPQDTLLERLSMKDEIIAQLSKRMHESLNTIRDYKKACRDLTKLCQIKDKQLEESNTQFSIRLRKMYAQLAEERAKCADFQNEIKKLKAELRDLAHKVKERKEENEKLEEKGKEKDKKIAFLEEKVNSLQRSLKEKDAEIEELRLELKSVKEEFEEMKAEQKDMKKQLKELQERSFPQIERAERKPESGVSSVAMIPTSGHSPAISEETIRVDYDSPTGRSSGVDTMEISKGTK